MKTKRFQLQVVTMQAQLAAGLASEVGNESRGISIRKSIMARAKDSG